VLTRAALQCDRQARTGGDGVWRSTRTRLDAGGGRRRRLESDSKEHCKEVRSQGGRAWPTPRGSQRVVGSVGQYGGGLWIRYDP